MSVFVTLRARMLFCLHAQSTDRCDIALAQARSEKGITIFQVYRTLIADVHSAINQMRVSGPRATIHGNSSVIAMDFPPHVAVFRRHFYLPNVRFLCCMLLQGTLGYDFNIFAASGESIAWVLLWKTRFKTNWRESLSCSPTRLFQHRISSA